jgi:Bacteriophage HK97-gp10, putative tail-component
MPADDDVQKYLANAPIKVKRQLATAIKAEADKLAAAIKAAAPVRSGALRNSVTVRRRKGDLDLEVTAGGDLTTKEVRKGSGQPIDYALSVEYGNRNEAAEPFFFSTARAMQPEITQNIQNAVDEALR